MDFSLIKTQINVNNVLKIVINVLIWIHALNVVQTLFLTYLTVLIPPILLIPQVAIYMIKFVLVNVLKLIFIRMKFYLSVNNVLI